MKKKAQAAMEFLMTYGWAILVVLAAIGALAYFGVLSPRNLLPSSCTVSAGFGCTDYKATASSVQFTLRNNIGQDLDQVVITFTGDVDSADCDRLTISGDYWSGAACTGANGCDDCDGAANCSAWYTSAATPVRNGKEIGAFVFDDAAPGGNDCGQSGNAITDFSITYRIAGESLTHDASGKANLKVES